MSDNRQETFWGMRPHNSEGVEMKKLISKWVVALCAVIALVAVVPAFAQGSVTTENVDLRQESTNFSRTCLVFVTVSRGPGGSISGTA